MCKCRKTRVFGCHSCIDLTLHSVTFVFLNPNEPCANVERTCPHPLLDGNLWKYILNSITYHFHGNSQVHVYFGCRFCCDLELHIHVYIDMYICIHICIYIYIYIIYIFIYINMYIHIWKYICVCVSTYLSLYIHIYRHMHIFIHI